HTIDTGPDPNSPVNTANGDNVLYTRSTNVAYSIAGTSTATQTVTVSNVVTPPPPPTGSLKVFVTQPTGGATVSNTVWAVMWLEGSTAASKTYTLTLGGKAMGSTTTASNGPVSMPYDTKMVVDGSQPLMATVKDASNNTGGSTVNVNVKNGIVTPPTPVLTAAFTSPASGATVTGTTTVGMSVSGSSASYAWNTSGVGNGSHTLSLTVTDTAGGSATATRSVTINNVTPPPATGTIKVYITQPTGGTVSGTQWVVIWLDNAAAGNK